MTTVSPSVRRGPRLRPDCNGAGYTTQDIANRYRVGLGTVLGWIRLGELRAINRAAARSGRPRWVITVDALAEFELGRQAETPTRGPRRRRRQPATVDFYPD
jgi:hypothetical protein